ncbi:MAG: hypothetical protein JSR58_01185 [Verrucomicrobia bacterium]|nr:hypothetical protein [Verrucomicrobiota bacterium]
MSIQFFLKLGLFDQIYLSYNGVKAAIETLEQSDPKLYARAHQIHVLFFSIDLGCLGYMSVDWLEHLDTFGAFSYFSPQVTIVAAVCVGAGLVVLAVLSVRYINDYFQTVHAKTDPVSDFSGDNIANLRWDRPTQQKVEQGLAVAQMVVTLSLAVLSSQPLFFLMATALRGYRLHKISELKWLYFEHGSHPHFLLVQKTKALEGEICKGCSKADPTIFYSDGLFHATCITSQVESTCPGDK